MKKLLQFSAYVFNPLLIPVYATLFYFFITRNYFYNHEIYLLFVQVLILTMLLPISIFYLLRSLGLIRTKMLLYKKERKLPLALYSILLFVLIKHSFNGLVVPELYYFFLGLLVSIIIALLMVMLQYKISLHVLGVTALVMFVIGVSAYYNIQLLYIIAFLVVASGMVASSRLMTNQQNNGGIVLGALAGTLPQILLWLIWLFPIT